MGVFPVSERTLGRAAPETRGALGPDRAAIAVSGAVDFLSAGGPVCSSRAVAGRRAGKGLVARLPRGLPDRAVHPGRFLVGHRVLPHWAAPGYPAGLSAARPRDRRSFRTRRQMDWICCRQRRRLGRRADPGAGAARRPRPPRLERRALSLPRNPRLDGFLNPILRAAPERTGRFHRRPTAGSKPARSTPPCAALIRCWRCPTIPAVSGPPATPGNFWAATP